LTLPMIRSIHSAMGIPAEILISGVRLAQRQARRTVSRTGARPSVARPNTAWS